MPAIPSWKRGFAPTTASIGRSSLQFLSYLGDIANGTFGMSFRFARMPVIEVIWTGLSITPILALAALFLAIPIGVVLGTTAALHRNSLADTSIILVLVAGISIPNFALASFLVYLFAIRLNLVPVAGWGRVDQIILPVSCWRSRRSPISRG